MGLLDKLKNMFTEEVEITEPIKRDVIQVEIPSPRPKREEEIMDDEVPEKEIKEDKKEEKPFPIFFDDKDFNDLEKTTKKPAPETPKRETKIYGGAPRVPVSDAKKSFKPSPIISPVYGILDKNYHKEDIIDKPKVVNTRLNNMTIDDIRKKAYGTLEDDLENTLTKTSLFYSEETLEKPVPADMDIFDELEAKIKAKKEEDEVDSFDLLDEDIVTKDMFDMSNSKEDEIAISKEDLMSDMTDDDKLSDSDLFDLIDTMYEKGDEDDN